MLFNSTILSNLVSLEKHLLRLVEIELFVQFNPPFANTFPVMRHFMKTALNRIFVIFLTFSFILNCQNKEQIIREYSVNKTKFNFEKITAKNVVEIEGVNKGIQIHKPYIVTLGESYFPELTKYEFEQPLIYWRDTANLKTAVSYFFTKKDSIVRVIEYSWSKPKDNDSIIAKIYQNNVEQISKIFNQKGKIMNESKDYWKQQIISWENDSVYVWSFIFSSELPQRTRVIIRQKIND